MNKGSGIDYGKIQETVHKIAGCRDLLECAEYLSEFVDMATAFDNKKLAVEYFRQFFQSTATIYMFDFLFSGNAKSCIYLTDSDAISEYIWLMTYQSLPPVKSLERFQIVSDMIQKNFNKPSGSGIKESFVDEMLGYLNDSYCFCNQIFEENPLVILSLENTGACNNGHFMRCDLPTGRSRYFVLLYHIAEEKGLTPQYVFLHELGHAVHTKFASKRSVPESFWSLECNQWLRGYPAQEQCEVFADAFAMAVTYKDIYNQYDPFPETNKKLKAQFAQYFDKLFDRMSA